MNLISTLGGMLGVLNPGSPQSKVVLDTVANFCSIAVTYAVEHGNLEGLAVSFSNRSLETIQQRDPRRRAAAIPQAQVSAARSDAGLMCTTDEACLLQASWVHIR